MTTALNREHYATEDQYNAAVDQATLAATIARSPDPPADDSTPWPDVHQCVNCGEKIGMVSRDDWSAEGGWVHDRTGRMRCDGGVSTGTTIAVPF